MKANLKDGFARVSVTLLHAWALLKLSDCAKSCLLMLVADTWGVAAREPGYMSSLTCGQLATKLKPTWARGGVYKAVDKLIAAKVVVKAANGCLGINPSVLENQTQSFRNGVSHLNKTRRRVFDNQSMSPAGESMSPPVDFVSPTGEFMSPPVDSLSPAGDKSRPKMSPTVESAYPTGDTPAKQMSPSVDKNYPHGDTNIKDMRAKKRFDVDDEISSTVTDKIARANLVEMIKAFVPLVASKTLRAEDSVLEDVKSVRTTAVKLFHALAVVYRAVDNGAFPRNLQGTIAAAARNPHNWPAQAPMQLLEGLRGQRKRTEYHEMIRMAKEKDDKAKYKGYLRQKHEENDRMLALMSERDAQARAEIEAVCEEPDGTA